MEEAKSRCRRHRHSATGYVVPLDFATTDLAHGLRSSGVDSQQLVFASWLGVVYYLTAETVSETSSHLGSLSRGSKVVLDYFEPLQHYDDRQRPGFGSLSKQVAAGGELWKSHFEPRQLAAKLQSFGFGKVDDLDSSAMALCYFGARTDGLAPKGPIHFVQAELTSLAFRD